MNVKWVAGFPTGLVEKPATRTRRFSRGSAKRGVENFD